MLTSRDFVPWRFSDAGRRSAWMVSSSRRPKTCTQADIVSSFNHLVGTREQRWRHDKAERFCSFKIQDKFEFGWLLYRKLPRLLALEDTIHVGRRASVDIQQVGPIGHETAAGNIKSIRVYRWHSVARSQSDDQILIHRHKCVRHNDQATSKIAPECGDHGLQFYRVLNRSAHRLH